MPITDLISMKSQMSDLMKKGSFLIHVAGIMFLIFISHCLASAQPIEKKATTFDWNQITISGTDAKLFPRKKIPFANKFFVGFDYNIGKMPQAFGTNHNANPDDIMLSINDELFNKLVERLSGSFLIPTLPHINKKILQNWYGIKLEYFVLPYLSVIAGEQITTGRTTVYFPITVAEFSSTGVNTKTFPKDGSYQLRMLGFNTEVGARYYHHAEKVSLFPEFSVGLYHHKGFIEDVKIRDISIPLSTNSKLNELKIGLGYGMRYRLLRNVFIEPNIEAYTLLRDTKGLSWTAGLSVWLLLF